MTTIDLDEADRHFAELDDRLRAAAVRGLQSAAFKGMQEILTRIIPSRTPQPVDRGVYRAGWRVILESLGATLENAEPVAVFVEYGVRAANVKPGRAMISALAEWVVRKGITTSGQAVSTAWAIAKNMQRRGIFSYYAGSSQLGGMRILTELLVSLPAIIEEEIRREIERLE